MNQPTDPAWHRDRESVFFEHVDRLAEEARLLVPTRRGLQTPETLRIKTTRGDRSVDIHREVAAAGVSDPRSLRDALPVAKQSDFEWSGTKWLIFSRKVARVRVVSKPAIADLVRSRVGEPIDQPAVEAALRELRESAGRESVSLVILGTSGFTEAARAWARASGGSPVILVEPQAGGGWVLDGHPHVRGLIEQLDPESFDEKRERVREAVRARQADLIAGALGAEKIAAATALPLKWVEDELQSVARESTGLAARRIDGQVLLFRDGSGPVQVGGQQMPMIDRIKALFSRKGEEAKKIEFLSEQRTALSTQIDSMYGEIGVLEKREVEFKDQFKAATGELTRRRVTGQLLQLRKDIERKQQMVTVLNQRINVISTDLHNLELVVSGKTSRMPDSDELATNAAAAEEMLAELEASNELAGSMSSSSGTSMSSEEQALYDELMNENRGESVEEEAKAQASSRVGEASKSSDGPPPIPAVKSPRQRSDPELG